MTTVPRRLSKPAVMVPLSVLSLVLAGCGGGSDATAASSVPEDCTPEHTFSTITEGELTVSTYDFAPHTVLDGDTLSGVEGDLLTEIAAKECLTLSVETAGGAGAAVPSVQSGRSDLAAGDWWRTSDRAKIVTLSDPIYLDQGAIVSTAGYQTIADLEGHKVGSVAGNLWNDDFGSVFGKDFTIYQDPEAAFSDLAAGRVDALIDSVGSSTARFATAPIEGAKVVALEPDPRIPVSAHPGQLNWPTNKDNPELTAALDAQIEALRADGTIAATLEKYDLDPSAAEVGDPDEL